MQNYLPLFLLLHSTGVEKLQILGFRQYQRLWRIAIFKVLRVCRREE